MNKVDRLALLKSRFFAKNNGAGLPGLLPVSRFEVETIFPASEDVEYKPMLSKELENWTSALFSFEMDCANQPLRLLA